MEYKEVISRYAGEPGGIIEAYHDLVNEYGYLPKDAVIDAATVFNLSVAEAYGIATFYSMFTLEPRGRNVVRVCQSAPCHLAGTADTLTELQQELEVELGETTDDKRFTLEHTECVGQCQSTPVFTINIEPYPGLETGEIASVVAQYK